ncbi:uncharacterized protein LOC144016402 isoform X2 [Festucalex cinctus]
MATQLDASQFFKKHLKQNSHLPQEIVEEEEGRREKRCQGASRGVCSLPWRIKSRWRPLSGQGSNSASARSIQSAAAGTTDSPFCSDDFRCFRAKKKKKKCWATPSYWIMDTQRPLQVKKIRKGELPCRRPSLSPAAIFTQ